MCEKAVLRQLPFYRCEKLGWCNRFLLKFNDISSHGFCNRVPGHIVHPKTQLTFARIAGLEILCINKFLNQFSRYLFARQVVNRK